MYASAGTSRLRHARNGRPAGFLRECQGLFLLKGKGQYGSDCDSNAPLGASEISLMSKRDRPVFIHAFYMDLVLIEFTPVRARGLRNPNQWAALHITVPDRYPWVLHARPI